MLVCSVIVEDDSRGRLGGWDVSALPRSETKLLKLKLPNY